MRRLLAGFCLLLAGNAQPVTVDGTADEQAVFFEAYDDLTAAGLELPGLTVVFGGDCQGHDGLYIFGHRKIRICGEPTRRLILHELGHAVDDYYLTDASRVGYATRWGETVDAWFDSGRIHAEGAERFANTVAGYVQGLIPAGKFNELTGITPAVRLGF